MTSKYIEDTPAHRRAERRRYALLRAATQIEATIIAAAASGDAECLKAIRDGHAARNSVVEAHLLLQEIERREVN